MKLTKKNKNENYLFKTNGENYEMKFTPTLILINNTKELAIGDVVIAIPMNNDIRRSGKKYSVRRAGVESVTDNGDLVMYDLDNEIHFMWDGNCDVTDDDNFIIMVSRF